jgi:hypothetical protein
MTLIALLMIGILIAGEETSGAVPCDDSLDNRVPLIQLIANPEKWDGKEVRVVGFARFEYEGDALYLSEEDYLLGLSESSIGIYVPYVKYGEPLDASIDTEGNDRQIVEIQGVFRAHKDGAIRTVGAFTGEIGPVCRLERWEFRRE